MIRLVGLLLMLLFIEFKGREVFILLGFDLFACEIHWVNCLTFFVVNWDLHVNQIRGTPWTEEEHRRFLCGLRKLGKGDWRGISRNYVPSRTPTQVASHAQKYFIRQSNTARRKKRSSLFDMASDMEAFSSSTPEQCSSQSRLINTDNEKHIVSSSRMTAGIESSLPLLTLTLKPAFMPLPFQLWPPNASSDNEDEARMSHTLIHKPAPVVRKELVKEMVGIPELNLGGTGTFPVKPSSLSLRLPGDS
ncbi:transcription factor KUA1-like isoform X2 [Primulina huaijiensis]|uniref:transcription factor KUA1-like isoform X2 n=1 Tax=Primulina huaijiensis TaxID=1492673 RepID=UPI003CC702FA